MTAADKRLGLQLRGLRAGAMAHIDTMLNAPGLKPFERAAWERMRDNIERVVIVVDPGKESLAEGLGYRIQGEHVVQSIIGKGLVEFIHLPKEFIFAEGRLTLQGMTTLFHEWAHNPLRFSGVRNGKMREFMEEQLADALAMSLAMKMRFPSRALFEHIVGREPFIGPAAYRSYLGRVKAYAEKRAETGRLFGARARETAMRRMAWQREMARRQAEATHKRLAPFMQPPRMSPGRKSPAGRLLSNRRRWVA